MSYTFHPETQVYVSDYDTELQQDLKIPTQGENTMKAKCTCKHPQQDALHGSGIRIFNITNKGIRCTVCATEQLTGKK